MSDYQRNGHADRDVDQAITALKKGATLLKYGRRGKPKFYPFQLSSDESLLIWRSGKVDKHIKLSDVSRIIPGQRTATFQRYPRPEKEYQSFSLICNDRSLDLICKDKDEAVVWLVGLRALITRGNHFKWRFEARSSISSESPRSRIQKTSSSFAPFGPGEAQSIQVPPQNRLGKVFTDLVSYSGTSAVPKSSSQEELAVNTISTLSPEFPDHYNHRSSVTEPIRISLSSARSSLSHESFHEDFDSLGDVLIWGEGIGDGILRGAEQRAGSSLDSSMDACLPQALESTVVLDVRSIACGCRHALLITKQGEIFSWGEESGGRLGHGVEADVSQPKLIDIFRGVNFHIVACGEYHTCAVSVSGDLYTWGDSSCNPGLLGHGSEISHWIPKRVAGPLEGIHISNVSCGLWHTAAMTSTGQLYTFGDGSFGVLGHGDRSSSSIPREVETLRGLCTTNVACGFWHTAAIVEIIPESSSTENPITSSIGRLFTWGDGDKGRLGHGDKEARLLPECVASLVDENICQVSCGYDLTVARSTSGHVYAMGSTAYGQLGTPLADGKVPTRVEGEIVSSFIEEISCGSYHVAVLTSNSEIYSWGKGTNGQLGHGDYKNRDSPTLVEFLKDKQVKNLVCGSNFTAVICLHKGASTADTSVCSSCHNPFNFRRKRHNCYNCGLVFCKACSSKRSVKASLAPDLNKPYRVCDNCYIKLKKALDSAFSMRGFRHIGVAPQFKTHGIADRDNLHVIQGVSLVSPVDSPRKSDYGIFNQLQVDLQNRCVLTGVKENFQLGVSSPIKTSSSLCGLSMKNSPTSFKMPPRSLSPLSRMSSPRQSVDGANNDLKHIKGGASHEITSLKAQVEELTRKCQDLEAELERTSMQLKEVKAIAADESQKGKSAREAVRSLTAQLEEMAERQRGYAANGNSEATARHITNVESLISDKIYTSNAVGPENILDESSANQMVTPGNKRQHERTERVIQDEPGVYITLTSLPGGGNELKRVRFSRKQFSEDQAEKWWAQNWTKVCDRHNIRSST